ncbi:hypothetical protein EJ066_07705 [Mesorhizobium sp. M9A.F.Ca.ET.002.03.1.2]|uniref:hypothetical protein n=1 Tax=Mesorhizobium sp. M9A.F.Ca.ET.002.03.1.2 TaxID=2493668 RepID=UPI000F75E407|nr:hypothetical protein [Mesorhizobium sp. M9A.F.Ca.ET.002.03.1.2]AZN97182.1 hypothetical protein EJ066_07705 [Mesorhizobium sp. M9A.F.Ca.ET.002.03.1.2]
MSDVSFSGSDVEFNRYLFEYRHGGAEWGVEIVARSPEEAKERIKSLGWARYQGEIKTTVHIPTVGLFKRIARRFFQTTL